MPSTPRSILAVVDDLMFAVKIRETAKRAGLHCDFPKSSAQALEAAAAAPALIIIDLNHRSLDPLDLIGKLKSDDMLKRVQLVCFVSHVEAALKQRAQQAGADMVLARSAFSLNLPQLLQRHRTSLPAA